VIEAFLLQGTRMCEVAHEHSSRATLESVQMLNTDGEYSGCQWKRDSWFRLEHTVLSAHFNRFLQVYGQRRRALACWPACHRNYLANTGATTQLMRTNVANTQLMRNKKVTFYHVLYSYVGLLGCLY
jgi:hypothetical protein